MNWMMWPILALKPLAGLGYTFPDIVNAMIKAGVSPQAMIKIIFQYRSDKFRHGENLKDYYPEFWEALSTHQNYSMSDLHMKNVASWVRDAVRLLPEEKRKEIDIVGITAEALRDLGRLLSSQETYDTMYYIARLECELELKNSRKRYTAAGQAD